MAHGGGLNADSCHTNRKTGDYHCHCPPARPAPTQQASNSSSQVAPAATSASAAATRPPPPLFATQAFAAAPIR
ncbi:YHYH domain-containing protein [Roseateles noduli]|uniref:YHYH domain-containing protein n=1 Tax=Roseateles noduli TaxID=2052484 RepID=UPI003D64DF25